MSRQLAPTGLKLALRVYAILFFILFIIMIVLSVAMPLLIEWPLSWYMTTEVSHTETAGWQRNSTEYKYFYRLATGELKELHILIVLSLATMFYIGVLIAVVAVFSVFAYFKNPDVTEANGAVRPKRLKPIPFLILLSALLPYFFFQQPEVRQWAMIGDQTNISTAQPQRETE